MTLYPDLLPISLFAMTDVCHQALFRLALLKQQGDKDLFSARNLCDYEVLPNLAKNSSNANKVGLQ